MKTRHDTDGITIAATVSGLERDVARQALYVAAATDPGIAETIAPDIEALDEALEHPARVATLKNIAALSMGLEEVQGEYSNRVDELSRRFFGLGSALYVTREKRQKLRIASEMSASLTRGAQ